VYAQEVFPNICIPYLLNPYVVKAVLEYYFSVLLLIYTMQTIPEVAHNLELLKRSYNFSTYYTIPHVGDYKFSARNADFHGWMVCDGRTLNIDEFPTLHDIIGDSFGEDGEGTFNLPDLRARVPAAISSTRPLGRDFGSETHTLVTNEMPSHTHTGTTASNGDHSHSGTTASNGDHFHNGTTDGAGGEGSQGLAAASGGNQVAEDAGTHSHTFTTSTNGAHTHTYTTSTNGAHTHTFTTESTGGGQAHNNMQPTLYIGNMFIFAGTRDIKVDPIPISIPE
jgi:microcystin-dependent protein